MSKYLREILKDKSDNKGSLSKNHRVNFEAKLQQELHTSKETNFIGWRMAASFLLIVGIGISLFYFSKETVVEQNNIAKIESLGSISPELKSIENYYLASIQTEISSLEETPKNKEMLDGYLEKIGELTTEYKQLTVELNEQGLNEKTINALIDNLQLRLKLLYQLKEQLKELKKLNVTENESINI